ncbi:UV excision repair protein [Rutstroemia sp. NJR-2017a BBW]|nr:UV excision repair protein [Rutstroemia sp. NJR-2017a BBW]
MTTSKVLPLSLGFLALASDTVMLIFNIILSATASKIVLIQRKDFHQQIQPYVTESERHSSSEMQEKTRTTRLVHSTSQRSSNFRPPSLDSTFCETIVSTEEDFDSWNTSGVDAQSREVIESASPSLPRFLETIPASPVGSRSPSPACPSDLSELEPPTRPRSRSYSPANSIRSVRTFAQPRITSFDSDSEAHIHPLFRSDSPGPAPAATPGTIVTAAPGAGTILSDVHSIRSVSRLRSESLTSIPRAQSPSLESLRRAIAEEERETVQTEEAERSLTPPIPEWIMGAGARSSMSEYNRKKARSIGKAGGRAGESMDY